jgi:hypothetical protein
MLRARFFGYFSIIMSAVALNTGPISATDLSGSCCGDLEERIAELEATAATKGNRKMSLTISGQVNRMIMWWDNGRSSNTYWGIDSTPCMGRFLSRGAAKGPIHFLVPQFPCSTLDSPFPRPDPRDRAEAGARRSGQGWAHTPTRKGLVLDGFEHDGTLGRVGDDDVRGELRVGGTKHRATSLYAAGQRPKP